MAGKRPVTDKRRAQILAKAQRDLGEPVVEVARVCKAFSQWGEASGRNEWPNWFEAMKSNLLFRLLYLREPLRTEKCPKHDGRWSGCSWSKPYCDCQKVIDPVTGHVVYDSNVTGWLLDGNPPATGECGSVGRVQADGSPLEWEPYDWGPDNPSKVRAVMRDTDIWVTCRQVSGHEGPCDFGH